MTAYAYTDQTTAIATATEVHAGICIVYGLAGVNQSGAQAWLQIYDQDPSPGDVTPIYSYPATDDGFLSFVLPGPDANNSGRRIDACWIGWSSTPEVFTGVLGSWNLYSRALA